ncbi:YdaS family helix-turn-helix protein [Xenorhabdus bovienii]|uniref:YdaS family helix-turn-helix protein n=1 Tax=Xenorhabdus bovienii TaxID=40576 RepID=UPI0023B2CBA3|nr:YdaS family helix-turn-helix protein [Xenorhabdus bovienii]MDE9463567.1 helix-turn-helix domain-containing protein [Xenorhabdus bovienii]
MSILEVTIQKAGGVPALARMLNVRDQAIRQWIKKGYIPPARYAQIHEQLGISLTELVKNK